MTEEQEIALSEQRDRVARNLERIVKERYDETIKIYCAPWDCRRIAWEETILGDLYHSPSGYGQLVELLQDACEGEDCYIEFENSVEGRIWKN